MSINTIRFYERGYEENNAIVHIWLTEQAEQRIRVRFAGRWVLFKPPFFSCGLKKKIEIGIFRSFRLTGGVSCHEKPCCNIMLTRLYTIHWDFSAAKKRYCFLFLLKGVYTLGF